MNISSMMSAIETKAAAHRVASGMAVAKSNGVSTSATTTAGPKAASGAAATGSAAASSSSSTGADITSADFLTLLVTEMQNQDPTAPTDPNAYIQQLVEVNSLQQLIAINSDLAPTPPPATAGSTAVAGPSGTALSAIGAATAAPNTNLFSSQSQGS
jgi:flagellar basal-body rod modification protein FlgD